MKIAFFCFRSRRGVFQHELALKGKDWDFHIVFTLKKIVGTIFSSVDFLLDPWSLSAVENVMSRLRSRCSSSPKIDSLAIFSTARKSRFYKRGLCLDGNDEVNGWRGFDLCINRFVLSIRINNLTAQAVRISASSR